eukprot:7386867-Prymnesium_polylepis.1
MGQSDQVIRCQDGQPRHGHMIVDLMCMMSEVPHAWPHGPHPFAPSGPQPTAFTSSSNNQTVSEQSRCSCNCTRARPSTSR